MKQIITDKGAGSYFVHGPKHAHRKFANETAALRGRCDSFVVETNVHYPTDINLLYDAIRKTIVLSSRLSEQYGFSDWRQHEHQQRQLKKIFNKVRKMKRSSAKNEKKRESQENAIKQAYCDLIERSEYLIEKAQFALACLPRELDEQSGKRVIEVNRFIRHGQHQIALILR